MIICRRFDQRPRCFSGEKKKAKRKILIRGTRNRRWMRTSDDRKLRWSRHLMEKVTFFFSSFSLDYLNLMMMCRCTRNAFPKKKMCESEVKRYKRKRKTEENLLFHYIMFLLARRTIKEKKRGSGSDERRLAVFIYYSLYTCSRALEKKARLTLKKLKLSFRLSHVCIRRSPKLFSRSKDTEWWVKILGRIM